MQCNDSARVNRLDLGVARKVSLVERQYAHYSMHPHGSDQACIVNLDTGDVIGNNQSSPFLMNRQTVGKQM
jgi:hypothetical protein